MNIRTTLAFLLTLSLAACTLMGIAAATAEATDATTGAYTYEHIDHGKMTTSYDAHYIVPSASEYGITELTAVTYKTVITEEWGKTVDCKDFELYGKAPRHIIRGSMLLPLNDEAEDSVSLWYYGTYGGAGFFGSDVTVANFDIVIPYNFNNPEDM